MMTSLDNVTIILDRLQKKASALRMPILEAIIGWADEHPRAAAAINRLDKRLGRRLSRVVQADTRRMELRMQIRACGGRAWFFEHETTLRAKLDQLARTGRP